jgi:hypothetical protein
MIKWLRKYNTYILVIGGCLLMVSFLVGTTLQDLVSRGIIGGKVMRVDGRKITAEIYSKAQVEHAALVALLDRATNSRAPGARILQELGGGENTDHWVMLVHEAEKGGFVGGVEDGLGFVPTLSKFIAQTAGAALGMPQEQIDQTASIFEQNMAAGMPFVRSDTRMTEEQMGRALARLHGIMRMRAALITAPRYGQQRLVLGVKRIVDSADVDLVVIPAERELAGIPEPDPAALAAHFERFKGVKKGEGEFGIGYTLPPRVKLEWLTIERRGVGELVSVDPVRVQEAFLRRFPTGKPPEGTSADDARASIEREVRTAETDRLMKSIDEAVRAEIGRGISRLERDNEYRFLPPDWATTRPRMEQIAGSVVARVNEQTGLRIPTPRVGVRTDRWQERADLEAIPGIGQAVLRRAGLVDGFADLVLNVRELTASNRNDTLLQVGVPMTEALVDAAGNRYYLTVVDARKESPADTLDEVRTEASLNARRLIAYERLKGQLEALRSRAVAEGLEALTRPVEGAAASAALRVEKATISRGGVSSMMPEASKIDDENFRNAVKDAAEKLDPLSDIKAQPAEGRTVASAIDRSLRVAIAQITAVKPLTEEQFRAFQMGMTSRLARDELRPATPEDDPFSLKSMEERLSVEYLDGRRPASERAAEQIN